MTAWFVGIPIAIAGSQVAHGVDYRVVVPNAGERAHVLAETGHRYFALVPLALALATVIVLIGLVGEARRGSDRSGRALRPWHFALLAPLVFSFQEIFERLFHDGSFPFHAIVEPTFLLGLALQIPFALAAFGVAWLLLRAAGAVGRHLGRTTSRRRLPDPGAVWTAAPVVLPRLRLLSLGFGTRGPPPVSL